MTEIAASIRRFKVALSIRVRGMSSEDKFFDETTETLYVSAGFIITRLRTPIDPDSEVHVTSKVTRQAGSFRTVWVNTREREGWYDAGMELLDVEGDLWGKSLDRQGVVHEAAIPEARLGCQRCHAILSAPVPEAVGEFIREGFLIARHCEKCKATTKWAFATERLAENAPVRRAGGRDDRRKGRAAIKMRIKVFCDRLGAIGEDTCETINISANGLYFTTQTPYIVGETLRIVAPFEEGAVAIPVPARVVRLDRPTGSSLTAVAVELNREGGNQPGKAGPARPA